MAAADAPRFRAYWNRVEGRSVFTMSRQDWEAIGPQLGAPVQLDVTRTPLNRVASNASVVAAVAHQYSAASAQITICRYDERDQPTPYNVDKYHVWLDLPSHQSFDQMIEGASTERNANFDQFMTDSVFIVGQKPNADHWLSEVPEKVRAVIDRAPSSRSA